MPRENHPTTEWQTRRRMIDPQLAKAGWQIAGYSPRRSLASYDGCAVTEYPTDNGPADYALVVNDQMIGIVEAKNLSPVPQIGAGRHCGTASGTIHGQRR